MFVSAVTARLAFSGALLSLAACATFQAADTYTATYDVALRSVTRPGAARAASSPAPAPLARGDSSRYRYEDELIEFQVTSLPTHFLFVLRNKSTSTLKLLWDEATYIDPSRRVSKVLHQGARFADPNLAQAPSVIPPETHLTDVIYPSEKALYRESVSMFGTSTSGWEHRPLLEPATEVVRRTADASSRVADFTTRARSVFGTRMGVLLPLQVEGVTHEYTFWFEVTGVSVKSPEPPVMMRDSFGRRRPVAVSAAR
jgi:hypothetical protein